jgi:hypothetical protein
MLTSRHAIQLYFRANQLTVVVTQRKIRPAALKNVHQCCCIPTEGSEPLQPQNKPKINVFYGESAVIGAPCLSPSLLTVCTFRNRQPTRSS